MTSIGTSDRPLRIAVIGSGPSGMYTAEALYKLAEHVQVDLFDRLPTPFGLLRGGVAPDHQKMKSLGTYYDRIFTKNPTLKFYGNVKVGQDIQISELKQFYDALIFCSGAETDRKLGITGEDLPGSHTATEFVGWYNGHPDYQDRTFNFNATSVAIIGQGNVAVDVTRILAKTPKELAPSDIAQSALDKLKDSQITTIYMIGRRGPVQAAFTHHEIQELGELEDCDIVVDPKDLELSATDQAELDLEHNSKARKNLTALQALADQKPGQKRKKIILKFFSSPVEIVGDTSVTQLKLETNTLTGEPGAQRASATGKTELIDAQMVFRSVGYRGIPISDVPFDEKRGTFPNEKGRIISGNGISGLYASGWIKRGPTGVLGTNKPDSVETVKTLLEDIDKIPPCSTPEPGAIDTFLANKNIRFITYEEWKKIDAYEIESGQKKGKPREKLTTIADILKLLD